MTVPLRSSRGLGRYVANEADLVVGTLAAWNGNAAPAIYCHGGGDATDSAYAKEAQRAIIHGAAERYAVCVADLGGATYGNDTAITRVGQAKAYLASAWGADGPVVLIGASMGTLVALAYARANPGDVAAVAGVIPALDIADLIVATDFDAAINAAYGGAYNDATHGPTHSPVQFADELDGIPVALWAADNDTSARPETVAAFLAARPETEVTWLGNLGHTEAAIAAAAAPAVEWLSAL